ncbi:MAG: Rpn family recombination-promoting nuclease/putative transposase [Anaerovoracaceae bacterium]
MKQMKHKKRNSKKYTICNPVIFSIVMQNPELCRGLLERIFPDRKVKEVQLKYEIADDEEDEAENDSEQNTGPDAGISDGIAETERTVAVAADAKSVRLDVLFENDEEWYDIELQVTYQEYLPQRSRYYQSVMTVYSMERGEEYSNLKPGYVIFICLFDPFEKNMPIYSFQMCDGKNNLILGDGQFTIFLNANCTENVPKELESFFRYLQTGEAPEGDVFLKQMDRAVEEAANREGVRERVTLYDEMLRIQTSLDRVKTEKDRIEAEKKKIEEEIKRAEEEIKQVETEKKRIEAEKQQAEEEKARIEAEKQQAEAEKARIEAEKQRAEEEKARIEAEKQQAEEEKARIEAEKQQAEKEKARIEAEKQRAEEKAEKALRRNRLTSELVKRGRFDELAKAETDETFRDKLMEELHI